MAALTAERNTPRMISAHDQTRVYLIAAAVKIFKGAIVVINSVGKAAPATTATTHRACVGRAKKTYDNSSGAADAFKVEVEEGVFKYVNLGADPSAAADVGTTVFLTDDQSISKTNGAATKSAAGILMQVDSDGVWVQMGVGIQGV